MDRIERMRVFVRVAELRSFTRAADALGLPKASVTTAVQSLEAVLKTKLLERTTRNVQLTSDGTHFLERCENILSDFEDAEAMFRSEAAELAGRIRVDTSIPVAADLLVPLLPEFLAKHPKLEIELSSTDRRVDLVRESIDCVIRSGKLGSEPGLVERPLARIAVLNLASRQYVERFGKPRSLEDLKKHKLIHYAQNFGGIPDGFEYFDGERYRELRVPGLVTVNNTVAYAAALRAGLGICQIPLGRFGDEVKKGEIVEVLPRFRAEPLDVKLIFPQRRILASRVRAFVEWVEPRLRARMSS